MSYLSCLLCKLIMMLRKESTNQPALALRWPSHLSRHLISAKLNCDHLSHNLMLAQQACWDGPYLSRHHRQRPVAEVAAPCQTKEELWSLRLNSTQGRIIGPRKNLRPASNLKILEKLVKTLRRIKHLVQTHRVIAVSRLLKSTPDSAINALWDGEDWRRTLIASKRMKWAAHTHMACQLLFSVA